MAIKIFITAGEPSGDKHAARLMKAIKKKIPDCKFIGFGGSEMQAQGLNSIISMGDISVVGFWEVVKKYSLFRSLMNSCKEIIKKEKPDIYIPVDYPGFNIRLSSFAKKQGIKVVYYIAPQLWAWGRNRTKKLHDSVDKLLVVFPFEERFFGSVDIDAEFVGHPLLEDSIFDKIPQKDNKLIALLPGSREQEIKNHLNLFLETTKHIPEDYKFGLARSQNVDITKFDEIKNFKNIEIWENSRELMKKAYYGVVKTGTSNLEAALCEMPFSMVYKTSFLTYQLAKGLINLDYISLVNILANKSLVPEIIQSEAIAENISESVIAHIENEKYYNFMLKEFKNIKEKLGKNIASERSAGIIKKILN